MDLECGRYVIDVQVRERGWFLPYFDHTMDG